MLAGIWFDIASQAHKYHCINKVVVFTTEWLPWLETNWRDSSCERFAFGIGD